MGRVRIDWSVCEQRKQDVSLVRRSRSRRTVDGGHMHRQRSSVSQLRGLLRRRGGCCEDGVFGRP